MKTEPISHIYKYQIINKTVVTMEDLLNASDLADLKPIPLSFKKLFTKYYYYI